MQSNNPNCILYPAGPHGVGKSICSEYLCTSYGFSAIETGHMVRSLYSARSEELQHLDLGGYITAMEEKKPEYFDNQLALTIDRLVSGNGLVVVSGMRSLRNIENTRGHYPASRHFIIWMQSELEILHKRYILRENRPITREQFGELLRFDAELGLDAIKDKADFTIENNSDLRALFKEVDSIMMTVKIPRTD